VLKDIPPVTCVWSRSVQYWSKELKKGKTFTHVPSALFNYLLAYIRCTETLRDGFASVTCLLMNLWGEGLCPPGNKKQKIIDWFCYTYEGISKSFRTGRLELELQMVQLSLGAVISLYCESV